MSTKATIGHDEKWHLYEDMLDETVWLDAHGFDFVVSPEQVSVQLPEPVIDAIRNADASFFPHLRRI